TYMHHKLYGACVNTTLILDPSGVWEKGHLTGTKLTSKAQVGDKACPKTAPSPEALADLQVVDCSDWTVDQWKKAKARNAHIKLLSLMRHPGVKLSEDARGRAGIQISHKSDPLSNGRLVAINDERGGGLNNSPGPRPGTCGGGIWFYDVRDKKNPVVARLKSGKSAVFFPGPNHIVNTEGSNCTSHVFWEWKGVRHLISAAWYSSGTEVFRYKANFKTHPATIKFYGKKTFVPPGASTWTSRIYRQQKNDDGTITLFFVATDIARGFDFFKLTLPAK
ncbi:MAG: hypothetical protein LC808_39415, partial [Actinobacteria bacterium]|nr:hypothetical protein [Actinomycetota bacterium]